MVDLDSNPTKLIEIVEIGKQLLITRGSLTTFSIANDVAKYFAIIPAMFAAVYPALDRLNIMSLGSPSSAILSAVIFNALIIVALIPLALRGVKLHTEFRGLHAAAQPRIYGLGGVIAPFIGIKVDRPRGQSGGEVRCGARSSRPGAWCWCCRSCSGSPIPSWSPASDRSRSASCRRQSGRGGRDRSSARR